MTVIIYCGLGLITKRLITSRTTLLLDLFISHPLTLDMHPQIFSMKLKGKQEIFQIVQNVYALLVTSIAELLWRKIILNITMKKPSQV